MTAHPIPESALDGDIVVLGRKGGGKTYTSKGIVERLLDLGRRVLVLDPLGVWAGLRTGADGETPGYPIAIFGGEHGDMPLDTAAAVPLANIIATENLPAVIDIADLSKSAQQSFLLKFLQELRRVNREALTIVLEEADVFAPQNPQGDDSKALHGEIDWISRRGRFRGFRLISICQRPARLSKDVLTQANTLIMHRLPAPQDRDAAKAWVDGNGDREQSKIVFDTLSSLEVGQAWILAQDPQMLEIAHFPLIKTLDTSATPKAGETRIEPKTLAQVDISPIKAALDADKEAPTRGQTVSKQEIAAAERRGFDRGYDAAQKKGVEAITALKGWFHQIIDDAFNDAINSGSPSGKAAGFGPAIAGSNPAPETTSSPRPVKKSATKASSHDMEANPLLKVARQVWPAKMTWAGLAAMCGRKARGGHFNNVRKKLLDGGFLREEGNLVVVNNPPATPEGVIPADLLEANLPQPAAKMFATIRKLPGLSIDDLGFELGMQTRGGHWNNGMSILRRNGLIDESDGLRIVSSLEDN